MSSDSNDQQGRAPLELLLPQGLKNAHEARTALKATVARAWQCEPSAFELWPEPAVFIGQQVKAAAMPPQTFAEKLKAAKMFSLRLALCSLASTAGVVAFHLHLTWQMQSDALDLTRKQTQGAQQVAAFQAKQVQQGRNDAQLAEAKVGIHPTLSLDLSPVFSAVENIAIPSARLQAFELDARQQRLNVSYALDSLSKVEVIHQKLSDAESPLQCQLSHAQSASGGVSAHWRCDF